MDLVDNLLAPIFLGVIGCLLIFRSETVGKFLEMMYRNIPHDKSALSDKQYSVRPVYLIVIGCIILAFSLNGIARYFIQLNS